MTGDLIELIGTFPHESYDYQNTNQFEDPIIIYADNRPSKPWQDNYYHIKPYETTTSSYGGPQGPLTHVVTQRPVTQGPVTRVPLHNEHDDGYVPIVTNGYGRPSYPGENFFLYVDDGTSGSF